MVEQRNLPARGFRPAYLLLGMGALMTYGFWRVGQGIREQKYGDYQFVT
jgi:NADH dehydrogenase (ubiquinone) 1 alpha subcomplex subunit 13